MLLTTLAFIAFAAQLTSANALLESALLGADTAIGTDWIWSLVTAVAVAKTTLHLHRAAKWMTMNKNHPETLARFQHWGMLDTIPAPNFAAIAIFSIWCGLSTYCAITIAIPTLANAEIISTPAIGYVEVAFHAIVTYIMPATFVFSRVEDDYRDADIKRRELEELRPIFHKFFPVSEILSMHQCMSMALEVFWEEYKALPDIEVTKATNRQFRERVTPYAATASAFRQRTALHIAGVAIVIALGSAAINLFPVFTDGQPLTEWLEEMFTTEGSP